MDPTKPILDIYGDSYSRDYQNKSSINNQNRYSNNNSYIKPANSNLTTKRQQELSYTELKSKYQELFQAYNDKIQKLNYYDNQVSQYKIENQKYQQQVERLTFRNQELNANLLKKNLELQEAYRRLQDQLKKSGLRVQRSAKVNVGSIDRLEQGLRQAINSNFELLKQASLAEVKGLVRQC